MTTISKKQLKTLIEYRETLAQLEELKRASPYLKGDFYYRRLKTLNQRLEGLKALVTNGKELRAEYDVEQYLVSY